MMSKNSHTEAIELFPLGKLLTIEEVSQILKLAVSTIYGWVSEKKIPFIKFGIGKSALRFNPWILNNWINKNSIKPMTSENKNEYSVNQIELQMASNETVNQFESLLDEMK